MKLFKNFYRLPVIIGPLPNTISNGQTEDATPLMANFNWLVNQVNANAADVTLVALLAAANTFTSVQSGVAATSAANFPIATQVQNHAFNTLTSTLGTNIITARALSLSLGAYATGQVFTFVPSQTNTGPANITIDSAGSSIIFSGGRTLQGGELAQSVPVSIMRDSTRMNIIGPPPLPSLIKTACQVTQAAGAYTLQAGGFNVTSINKNGTGDVTVALSVPFTSTTRMFPMVTGIEFGNFIFTLTILTPTTIQVIVRDSTTGAPVESGFVLNVAGQLQT